MGKSDHRKGIVKMAKYDLSQIEAASLYIYARGIIWRMDSKVHMMTLVQAMNDMDQRIDNQVEMFELLERWAEKTLAAEPLREFRGILSGRITSHPA